MSASTDGPAATGAPVDGGAVSEQRELLAAAAEAGDFQIAVFDNQLAAAAGHEIFGEVHLIGDGTNLIAFEPSLTERDEIEAHPGPASDALDRVESEVSEHRVLWVLASRLRPRAIGDGSAMLASTRSGPGSRNPVDEPRTLGEWEVAGGTDFLERMTLLQTEGRLPEPPDAPAAGTGAGADALRSRITRLEQDVERLVVANDELIAQNDALVKRLRAGGISNGPLGPLVIRLKWARARSRPLLGSGLGVLEHHSPRRPRLPAGDVAPPVDPPRISIVVPSYNQAEYLPTTLDSILDQGYPDLQLILQDGGSDDGTADVLDRYADRIDELTSAPDGGQAEAVDTGFRKSDGEIMAWLNSDDILLPGSLAYVARFFAENPDVDVIYGHRLIIDSDGREIGRWIMPPHEDEALSWADFVPQETMFWRRSAWDRAGGKMNTDYRFALDWDLLLRLRDSGARFERLPRLLGGFRVHQEQKTSAQVTTLGKGEMARIRRRIHGRRVNEHEVSAALRGYRRRQAIADKLWRLGIGRG